MLPRIWTGRQIARLARAGEAKSHWQDRYLRRIVERLTGNPQPGAKALAACIIERNARFVNPLARRLGRNQDSRQWVHLQNRSRPKRKVHGALRAGPYFGQD